MAREKKVKIKNINKLSFKGKASSLAFALLALVLTIIAFGGLLFLRNMVSDKIIYQSVVVAKQEIPENEIITTANATSYFTMKDVNTLDTTSGYMTSVDGIMGMQAKVSLLQGEIVSEKDFRNVAKFTEDFADPIEISVDIGAIANADGGKIRGGDVVNIAMMFDREQLGLTGSLETVSQVNGTGKLLSLPDLSMADDDDGSIDLDSLIDDEDESDLFEDDTTVLPEEVQEPVTITTDEMTDGDSKYNFEYYANYVLENVYVSKALDSAGTEISPTDKDSTASILIFVIDKSEESAVNNALANCSNIRVSKVVNKELEAERDNASAVEVQDEAEKTLAEQMAEDAQAKEEQE